MAASETFDVVVVGGGSAGCVVAARLAALGSRSVLLVEAGPDLRSDPTQGLRDGWQVTRQPDWGFVSEPDERGAVANVWRHRLVGGNSWATRFAVRGSPADYDHWATLGNAGWGFDDVLPYFKRLEADADFGDQTWHGDEGPIPITRYLDIPPTDAGIAALSAFELVGFRLIEDHNEPWAVGAGRMPMSTSDGQRVTTADAYLPLGGTPPNLTIRPDTHVADVVLNGTRATGIRLLDGTIIEANWIVVSAGTYGSPPILMRSGIGPAAHLNSVGLPVLVDLPGVGENLADHPAVSIEYGYCGRDLRDRILHSIATFHSASASSDEAPDLMLWTADPEEVPGEQPVVSVDAVLLKPHSRGTVRLRSVDPFEGPQIILPHLSEGSDVERLGEAYRRAWDVVSRPEMRRLCDDLPTEIRDAEELRGWIRANRYSVPHTVGTCAMGPSPDDGAVVDASGCVYGTERLSVVDASIMPDVPSGFPHISAIMLAERLSELIDSRL